jgi:ABC-type antimicrobial peptide transport system permease subunit
MFFITYLRRELNRRMRQAIFIALGLALGVGLVVTVAAARPGARGSFIGGTALIHVVPVPLHPSASTGVITLAVVLALAGGLLAGALGSWRIARLRPADALARVA